MAPFLSLSFIFFYSEYFWKHISIYMELNDSAIDGESIVNKINIIV